MQKKPDPHLFVVFGGTGDLMRRELLPGLQSLARQNNVGATFRLLAVAREQMDDESYRASAIEALREFGGSRSGDGGDDHDDADGRNANGPNDEGAADWCNACLHYESIQNGSAEDYGRLKRRIEGIEQEAGLPGNRIFYLALPPRVFPDAIASMGDVGLNQSDGWTRLVVEKPFGRDLESARELNALVHRHYDEQQIYRIDHYLGKETVQNLLVFRFANQVFESLWNRDRIKSVQITVSEELGVGTRAGYFEHAGATRDMVQNHLTQLLTLMAMEAPPAFEADAIRDEKVKVLRSITPIRHDDVVFGRYEAGVVGEEHVRGYLEEDGVSPQSEVETFVALRVQIANWRWQGVPFYLRTGKRLRQRLTQIIVNFHKPPVSLFEPFDDCNVNPNALVLTIQPKEGFHLSFEVKKPGQGMSLRSESLRFLYADEYTRLPSAYETLLHDVMTSDQTLFVRADEVENSWRLFDPLLAGNVNIAGYEAGTWGPHEAGRLLAENGDWWFTV
jgi:glucose-6-phosphate 1-dehydrogenase